MAFNISFRRSPANTMDTVFMTSDKRVPVMKSRYPRILPDFTSVPVDWNPLHYQNPRLYLSYLFLQVHSSGTVVVKKMWIMNAMGSRPQPRAGPWPEVCQWLSLYLCVCVCVREREPEYTNTCGATVAHRRAFKNHLTYSCPSVV